jgi:type II secretory pathway component GspD/PulD (secretin)
MRSTKLIAIALLPVINGCATDMPTFVAKSSGAREVVNAVVEDKVQKDVVTIIRDTPHMRAVPVEYVEPLRGTVTLQASDLPLNGVVQTIAKTISYNVGFLSSVVVSQPVSVALNNADPIEAIREIALNAGYIALFDHDAKQVTVAREGLVTYRLPPSVMSGMSSRFSASGGTQGFGRSGQGGQPGGTGVGGANTGGSSSSSGSTGGLTTSVSATYEHNSRSMLEALRTATKAEITVVEQRGLLIARGDGTQIKRLTKALEAIVADALTQVEVELALINVSNSTGVETGIDWSRVLDPGTVFGSASGAVSVGGGNTIALDGGRIAFTTKSINGVVRALERDASVKELSRPLIVAQNHLTATSRKNNRRPTLPSVTTTTTPGSTPILSSSGSLEYIEDGTEFSVLPHVIDSTTVNLVLMPVTTTIGENQEFKVGKDATVSAPSQTVQSAVLNIVASHGKTMIVSGLRNHSQANSAQGLPFLAGIPGVNVLAGGTNGRSEASEVVMLVHVRVIPAPKPSLIIKEMV